jgi:hypothetical protein
MDTNEITQLEPITINRILKKDNIVIDDCPIIGIYRNPKARLNNNKFVYKGPNNGLFIINGSNTKTYLTEVYKNFIEYL